MTVYDTQWWKDNGATWREPWSRPSYKAQEAAVAKILPQLVGVRTVLEVGAGYGRITRLIREAFPDAAILATDVAPLMEGVEFFDLENGAEKNAQAADLVVAAEVLMHRPPDKVVEDVETLCAMASRYVLTVDWHEDSARKAAGCYQHDYRALFGGHGFVNETAVPEARQAVYLTALGGHAVLDAALRGEKVDPAALERSIEEEASEFDRVISTRLEGSHGETG